MCIATCIQVCLYMKRHLCIQKHMCVHVCGSLLCILGIFLKPSPSSSLRQNPPAAPRSQWYQLGQLAVLIQEAPYQLLNPGITGGVQF